MRPIDKRRAGFFLYNQYSVGGALIFRGWGGGGGGGGGKLEVGANTTTPHRNTYKNRTEEPKKTENRTEITQKFLNTANRLVL